MLHVEAQGAMKRMARLTLLAGSAAQVPEPLCVVDKHCARGQICTTSGFCVKTECANDADCEADQRCAIVPDGRMCFDVRKGSRWHDESNYVSVQPPQRALTGEGDAPVVVYGNDEPGLGQLRTPGSVSVDSAGNIFVAEMYDHRVMKWSPGASEGKVVAGGQG